MPPTKQSLQFGRRRIKRLMRHPSMLYRVFSRPNLYFKMPKVASKTIAAALSADTLALSHRYSPATVRRLLQLNPRSFKFTFVRHPFTRFCSAYRWAIREDIRLHRHSLDFQLKQVVLDQGDVNDFCSNLAGLLADSKQRMLHFHPQSAFIFSGEQGLMDFVGKYEFLEQGCAQLRDFHAYDLNVVFGQNEKNREKTGIEDPMASLAMLGVNASSMDTLRSIYAQDFCLFDYDPHA
jgi:hypothetical protein